MAVKDIEINVKTSTGYDQLYPQTTVGNLVGVTATTQELNYTSGVTSNIQTQLNGKAATSHNQAASTITAGTLGGQVVANATATATLGTSQVRNIYIGTSDMTPGTTALATGDIYYCYEA